MSKDAKLTNIHVPPDPKLAFFDALRSAPPIDMKNYENVGEVEHHESVESVAAKMIAKQEAARGVKINQEQSKETVNLGGIKDDRRDRVFWRPR